jgi:putative FmdB family regulatory protein
MPLYTYQCQVCPAPEADYLVKFSDPIPPCKECGSIEQEKKLSTGTAFCLMNFGWSKNGMNSKKVGNR